MSIEEIMKTPYIIFVLGSLDAPSVDYDSKKKTKTTPKTADEEIAMLTGFLSK